MFWLRILLFWPFDLIDAALRHWPGALGYLLRYGYYKIRLGHCGAKVIFEPGVYISGHRHIFISDKCLLDRGVILVAGTSVHDTRKRVTKPNPEYKYEIGQLHLGKHIHLAPYSILIASEGISLGDNAAVGAHACLYSISNHHTHIGDQTDFKRYAFSNRAPAADQFLIVGAITVGSNAAVGMHAVLLPGAQVSNNMWVKVGSIVLPAKQQ